MKRNAIPVDNALTVAIRNKTRALINASLSAGDIAGAVQYMRFAARDFEGTPFASEMSNLLSGSEVSADYRGAIKDWNRMAANEQARRDKYFNYLNKLIYSGSFPDTATAWWNRETASLVRLRDKGNPSNSQMASRVLNFISILCSEQGNSLYRNNSFLQASVMFQICTISDSDNPLNYYNLARSYAANGKTKESVDALSQAVTHGFKSRKTVEADPAFERVREDQRYKALIIKIK
jgi:tetratricopeptide (TPR) repeat protein